MFGIRVIISGIRYGWRDPSEINALIRSVDGYIRHFEWGAVSIKFSIVESTKWKLIKLTLVYSKPQLCCYMDCSYYCEAMYIAIKSQRLIFLYTFHDRYYNFSAKPIKCSITKKWDILTKTPCWWSAMLAVSVLCWYYSIWLGNSGPYT